MSIGYRESACFPPMRYYTILAVPVLFGLLFSGAVVYRQVSVSGAAQSERVERQHRRGIDLPALRGNIYDRNGLPLAISVPEYDVTAQLGDMRNSTGIEELIELLEPYETVPGRVRSQLSRESDGEVTLARGISLRTKRKLEAMHRSCELRGLHFEQNRRGRYYPIAEAGALITGYINHRGQGQAGLERAFSRQLRPQWGRAEVTRVPDRGKPCHHLQRDIAVRIVEPARDGRTLHSSLDGNLQVQTYRRLVDHVKATAAKRGSVAVLNAETGEVLALANYPSFTPNKVPGADALTPNIALHHVIEPGSTLKPFFLAAGMEFGLLTPEETIDLTRPEIRINGELFRDPRPLGVITRSQALVRSSQVGAVDVFSQLPERKAVDFLRSMGFTHPLELNLGAARGAIAEPSPQLGYGYGMNTNLLQLLRAYAVFVNGGYRVRLMLERTDEPTRRERVLSGEVASALREILYAVVEDPNGTGRRAGVEGYRIGGKTGTAQSYATRYDGSRYNTNFIGFIDSDPALVVGVWLLDVGPERHYASNVAAPLARDVFKSIINTQGLLPQDTLRDSVQLAHHAAGRSR
ncbi:MAG: penicillin-binding protein 2 [Gammaproteobacteria bacterium AqS3]|nr:penicillin-binding protein 2 [Gammaproteobacteria bacterium AqS3]